MTTYTHTAEQHAQLLTLRLQLLDSPNPNDHKAASLLDWAVTAEPARPLIVPEWALDGDDSPEKTRLANFIDENEPAGGDETDKWRKDLRDMLAEVSGREVILYEES